MFSFIFYMFICSFNHSCLLKTYYGAWVFSKEQTGNILCYLGAYIAVLKPANVENRAGLEIPLVT